MIFMKVISFKNFSRDYKEYYNEPLRKYSIRTESEMQEVLYDIYDTDKFEVDYENQVIELY